MPLSGAHGAATLTGRRWAAGLVLGLVGGVALAQGGVTPLTPVGAYEAALHYDAQYQVSLRDAEAARQGVPLARSTLLPQVTLNASIAKVTGSREFGNGLNQSVRVPLDYESPQVSLNLRTPVFNYESLYRVRQATSAVEGAEALLQARHLDLVNRLTTAYLEVLVQQEGTILAAEDLRSLQSQAERSRQRFVQGEGTVQDATAAEAAAELAKARLARSGDDLAVARQGLRRITGVEALALRAAPADFAGLSLPLPRLEDWIEQSLQNSPMLRYRRTNVDAAGYAIERQRAGHLPRLDLVASVARAQNDSVSTLNQTTQQRSIGLQLAVPIYSGGAVEAGLAQTRAERHRAEEELRAERESVRLEVERLYRLAAQGRDRLAANAQSLEAAGVAVKAASRALETGLGTAADYRAALARQATARRDLIQSRYEFLNQRSQLLVISGWPIDSLLGDLERTLSVDTSMKDTQP